MPSQRELDKIVCGALRALIGVHDPQEVSRRLLAATLKLTGARGGEIVLRDGSGEDSVLATRGSAKAPADLKRALRASGRALGEIRLRKLRALSDSQKRAFAELTKAGSLALEGAAAHRRALAEAQLDSLTLLPTRGRLREALEQETIRLARYNRVVSLVMFDIDGLSHLNDEHGHPAGDEALVSLAHLLRGRTRESDTVARYGGDEFMLVLPEAAHAGALSVAEKICASVAELKIAGDRVTVSAGVATAPDDGRSADELVRAVDARLYLAKRAGGNRVVADG